MGAFCFGCSGGCLAGVLFWLVFGLFWACLWCGLINWSAVVLSCILGAFLCVLWGVGCFGVMQNKKDNKKTGFICARSFVYLLFFAIPVIK